LADGAVSSAKILDGTILTGDIATDTILAGNIALGAVETSEILDGTIANADVSGTAAIAGTKISPAFGAQDVTGTGTLGTLASRWSTIYASTLNYATALTDGGAAGVTAITLGTATNDTITIAGAIQGASPLVFDGPTAGTSMTTLAVTDPTGANTVTLPNASGTIVLTGSTGTVDSTMLLNGTIGTLDIATDTILAGNIAAGAVGTSEILDGTILTGDISTGGVATGNILDGTILNADLDGGSYTGITTVGTLTSLTVGAAGTAVTQIRNYAPTLTPVATDAAIGTAEQTFTVAGLATTDKVIVNGPVPTSLCPAVTFRVSAVDTLAIGFTTLTAAACTPAAGVYNIVAIRN